MVVAKEKPLSNCKLETHDRKKICPICARVTSAFAGCMRVRNFGHASDG